MLTIYTPSQVARVPFTRLRRLFGPAYPSVSSMDATRSEFDSFTHFLETEDWKSVDEPIMSLLGKIGHSSFKRGFLADAIPGIALEGSDGECVELPLPQARKLTLVRDYLSEYPNATKIVIPYPWATIRAAVHPLLEDSFAPLHVCLECVKYLNPIRNTYYLDFDLDGVDAEDLLFLHQRGEEYSTGTLCHTRGSVASSQSRR